MDICRSHNVSNPMVILRCIAPEAFLQEKVFFPFERWSSRLKGDLPV
jgi:hypothetical protein